MEKNETFPSLTKLMQALHSGTVEVKFTKVSDGSLRTMLCTLDASQLPIPENDGTDSRRMNTLNTTCVWDLEAKAWRSFRNENIISWTEVFDEVTA